MIIAQAPAPAPLVRSINSVNPTGIISCPAVTKFMQFGNMNDAKEVANLQSALKNIEKIGVDVTGEFDARTEEAIKIFQRRYMAEVMAPWRATRPSGIVNITTAKKVNNIACNAPMILTAAELAVIDAYNARTGSPVAANVQSGATAASEAAVAGTGTASFGSTADPDELLPAQSQNISVAAVGAVSETIPSKFWRFLGGLFGR